MVEWREREREREANACAVEQWWPMRDPGSIQECKQLIPFWQIFKILKRKYMVQIFIFLFLQNILKINNIYIYIYCSSPERRTERGNHSGSLTKILISKHMNGEDLIKCMLLFFLFIFGALVIYHSIYNVYTSPTVSRGKKEARCQLAVARFTPFPYPTLSI